MPARRRRPAVPPLQARDMSAIRGVPKILIPGHSSSAWLQQSAGQPATAWSVVPTEPDGGPAQCSPQALSQGAATSNASPQLRRPRAELLLVDVRFLRRDSDLVPAADFVSHGDDALRGPTCWIAPDGGGEPARDRSMCWYFFSIAREWWVVLFGARDPCYSVSNIIANSSISSDYSIDLVGELCKCNPDRVLSLIRDLDLDKEDLEEFIQGLPKNALMLRSEPLVLASVACV